MQNNIGVVHKDNGNYDEAERYFNSALKLFEKDGRKSGVAVSYANLGDVSFKRGQFEESLKLYNRSLEINQKLNIAGGISYALQAIGNLLQAQKDYKGSLPYFERSLEINRENSDKLYRIKDQLNYAKALRLVNKLIKAQDLAEASLEAASEISLDEQKKNAYKELSEIYKLRGLFKESRDFLAEYSLLNDSISAVKSLAHISSLEYNHHFEIEQQKKEAILEQKIAFDKILRNFLILVIVLLLSIVFLLVRNNRFKKKSNERLSKQKNDLEDAIKRIKSLEGILPVCSSCKKIRKEESDPKIQDNWQAM